MYKHYFSLARKVLSTLLILFLSLNPVLPVAQVYAQEATASAEVEVSPTPEVSATPEVTLSPDVTPSAEPSVEPSVSPEVSPIPEVTPGLEPSPSPVPSDIEEVERQVYPRITPDVVPSPSATPFSDGTKEQGGAALPTTPVSDPPGGTHYGTLYVHLTSDYDDYIRYTIDGSTPTCSTGTVYSGIPMEVAATTTLKAIACSAYGQSTVMTSVYTITSSVSNHFLAEGYIGGSDNFKTNILIENPQASAATVDVTYVLTGEPSFSQTYTVAGNTRATIGPPVFYATSSVTNFATIIRSNQNITVERTMYWDSNGVTRMGGHAAAAARQASSTWFFAEGFLGGANNFKTNFALLNQKAASVDVTVNYYIQGGGSETQSFTMSPKSRTIIGPSAALLGKSFSTVITSTQTIVAERIMYWDSAGISRVGGTASQGISATGTTWYLPEGFTGGASNFKTNILIYNPGVSTANVTVTYMLQGGGTVTQNQAVGTNSRVTMGPPDSMLGQSFSTKVTSDQPIVVERTMYWDANGVSRKEGHASAALSSTNNLWYLAEGYIGGASNFKTNVLIQNPTGSAITVTVTFMTPTGATETQNVNLPALSRATVGPSTAFLGQSFSTKLQSASQFVVERTMYWDAGGYTRAGGHASSGITLN